jgi:3-oxoacyl-[acyl-carrier-protein] synthase-3
MVKLLGLRKDALVARDVCRTGNTSSASIPLGLEALRREHGPLGGRLALQIGFGAGLAYAAQVVELPDA